MARAGFVYTPQGAGDDTVVCLYCNLSLSGWEKEDDPLYGSYFPMPITLLILAQSGTPYTGQ